jgi:outer membrane protein assembly factor BamB
MITFSGELTYGPIYLDYESNNELYISEKIVGIKKIVSTQKYYYILVDSSIYYNDTLSNDNFIKVTCGDIEFLDMDISNMCLFALDINSMLYKIIDDTVTKLDYNFDTIVNIYGSHTYHLILKYKNNDHYILLNICSDAPELHLLGNYDRVYYMINGFILIKHNTVRFATQRNGKIYKYSEDDPSILVLLSILRHNFDYLYQIPSGAFLNFCDGKKIMSLPCNINDTITYRSYLRYYYIYICSITNNVYGNIFVEIPALKNLCSSTKHNASRNIKSANNVFSNAIQ